MEQKRKYVSAGKLTNNKVFKKWNDWDEGDIVIGKYIGTHEDTTYEKTHYVISVEEAFFKDPAGGKDLIGKDLVLNSCANIDSGFKAAKLGEVVQVTYNGMGVAKGGKFKGKDQRDITVERMVLDGETGYDASEEMPEGDDDDGL